MNRLLQHFVADPSAAPSTPASRPPIPAPPQSSGGSYNAGNRGSYQRTSPNGPFYYQPPPQQHYQQRNGPFGNPLQHSEGHGGGRSSGGLEEIPLSSQSTGGVYETVDLNADSSQQHRPHPQHQQQRLFTPPSRLSPAPNSQGRSYNTPLYKAATPPVSGGSSEGFQRSQPSPPAPFYQHQNTGSTGSAAELFASAPPTAAKDLFAGSTTGDGGNVFRRQAPSVNHGFAVPPPENVSPNMMRVNTPPKDPFAASPSRNSSEVFSRPAATSSDTFATPRSGNGTQIFGGDAGANGNDPFAMHTPANNGFGAPQDRIAQDQRVQSQQSTGSEAVPDPFASSPAEPHNSLFDSPAPSNGDRHSVASVDSLFSSPAPTHNGDWSVIAQPAASPTRTQNLFPDAAPSASSLFGGSAPQISPSPPPMKTRGIASPQFNASTSPPKPQTDAYPSLVLTSQVGVPPSPVKPEATIPPSPVKMENHLTSSLSSMKMSTTAKSPLKPGLDVRHMYSKIPTGKRDDDAVSLAPSRMSMLSTLDDSLKLSDMYKQMTGRLEGEKSDLLKVVANQADEIAQMKKQIKSLELQLKKYRAKDA